MNNIIIPRIICSGKNCNKVFSKEWDEYGFSYIQLGPLPIDDDDKVEKIWFALMKTRLFCSDFCQDYTNTICSNSKIDVK
jgi:hypothetical protein